MAQLTLKDLRDQHKKALHDPILKLTIREATEFTYVTLRLGFAKMRQARADENHRRWARKYNNQVDTFEFRHQLKDL